jgi:hypothetical protein
LGCAPLRKAVVLVGQASCEPNGKRATRSTPRDTTETNFHAQLVLWNYFGFIWVCHQAANLPSPDLSDLKESGSQITKAYCQALLNLRIAELISSASKMDAPRKTLCEHTAGMLQSSMSLWADGPRVQMFQRSSCLDVHVFLDTVYVVHVVLKAWGTRWLDETLFQLDAGAH